jgi:hypothetical protein
VQAIYWESFLDFFCYNDSWRDVGRKEY